MIESPAAPPKRYSLCKKIYSLKTKNSRHRNMHKKDKKGLRSMKFNNAITEE